MKLTLIILSFLLLFQTNTQASYVRNRHVVAVKAFVLERKKAECLSRLSVSALSGQGSPDRPPFLLYDLEEEEDSTSFNIKKFKLLCGFYLIPPSIYQSALNQVIHHVKTDDRFNSQIFYSKYLVQRSLRI